MIIIFLILIVLLVFFFIWITPAIILGVAALGAIFSGVARGTKQGVANAVAEERPVGPRVAAMRASSARMKAERLAKKAAKQERHDRLSKGEV